MTGAPHARHVTPSPAAAVTVAEMKPGEEKDSVWSFRIATRMAVSTITERPDERLSSAPRVCFPARCTQSRAARPPQPDALSGAHFSLPGSEAACLPGGRATSPIPAIPVQQLLVPVQQLLVRGVWAA
jgi:hypothetical protein